MTLTDPFWLVLIVPTVLAFSLWRLPTRRLRVLRYLGAALLLSAICGLSVKMPLQSGTLIVVADRSLSMPGDAEVLQREAVDLLHGAKRSGDQLAVVSFGHSAAVEHPPQSGEFSGFSAEVGGEASHLAEGLELALSLCGRERPGRILVLSDGQWTGRDPAAAAARAAAAGIAVDYRLLQRPTAGDLAVERVQTPAAVTRGESFMMTAWVQSPTAQPVQYRLQRGSQIIAEGTQSMPAGTSRLLFRDTASERGTLEYTLHIQGRQQDPRPENNVAEIAIGVRGPRSILCVSPRKNSQFASLLTRGGLDVAHRTPAECRWTLSELAGHSAVILENAPAGAIGFTGMRNLAAWVSGGGGLMLTGGQSSFGQGGYYKSPLEPILPVSMELRREHRKLSIGVVVALDRSGSMAMPADGGRQKMDLANLGTTEVLEMLGPTDQFGCIAVDSTPHEIVPLSDVVDKAPMRSRVLRIRSEGGGIFIYEALVAAADMVRRAQAGTKHIILFADASDSEEPGNYKELVQKCVDAGITISVIGLGTERDRDAELLKDIAKRGKGVCMFTNVAQDLPRLFAQDMLTVARNAFLDQPAAVRPTGGLMLLTRRDLGEFPSIGGYNLCYLRPKANLAVVSQDEYQAPITASWQAGLGRVLCYTGEVDGRHTGAVAQWKHAGDFFTSLAGWVGGNKQGLGEEMVVTQELRHGISRIELHLDPTRQTPPFAHGPEVTVLSAVAGGVAATKRVPMHWASADMLLAEVPLRGNETVLPTVEVPEVGRAVLAPMRLPYPMEFAPEPPERGRNALEHAARATGGRERTELPGIWNDIPKRARMISLAPYLLATTILVFFLEVLHRRTGLLSWSWRGWGLSAREALRPTGGRLRRLFRRQRSASGPTAATSSASRSAPAGEQPPASSGQSSDSPALPEPKDATPAAPAPNAADGSVLDTLRQAQRRARSRTDRGHP